MPEHAGTDTEHVEVTVGIPTRNRSDMLRRTIASVLEQSHRRLTLIVSDNASEDDTAEVVASFDDPRIVYSRPDRLVPRPANYNRLVELAETEYVLLLADDDELHPDHLAVTLGAVERWPTVGVAHTGFVIVGPDGQVLAPHINPFKSREPGIFETGAEFLERMMRRSAPSMAYSTAIFRKAAYLESGGLREEDGVTDDFVQLMRAARRWDFAYVNRPLARIGAHTEASSSDLGYFMDGGFRSERCMADIFYANRRTALTEAALPEEEARRLFRLAQRRYRQDVLAHLSMRSDTGDGATVLFRALADEIRQNRRLAVDPLTARFVVGQLGARRVRSVARRARSVQPAARA
jgi:glycosyltransferase involved in cell wall biosynthesis